MAQRKKSARPLLGLQPLFPVERLVANEGWVTSPVKAISRRRRGPKARLYRACHPARLGHRGRRLATARPLRPPSLRGFTPPVTEPKPGQEPPQPQPYMTLSLATSPSASSMKFVRVLVARQLCALKAVTWP